MLEEMAHKNDLLFLALTETHLNSDHLNIEVSIENYTVFRRDRINRSHGGVAIYIKEEVAVTTEEILCFSNGTTEVLGLFMQQQNLVLIL